MKRAIGIVGVLALLAAGCGGGGTPSGEDATPGLDVLGDISVDPGSDPGGSDRDVTGDPGQVDPDATGSCTPGEPCDDGDPCTWEDQCNQWGECDGRPVPGCDDGLDCTEDACPEGGECTHTPLPGWCLIDEACYEDGEVDPANPCQACVTALFTDRFVTDDTLTCEDGDPCTLDDRCVSGLCVGGAPKCDDGNPCTEDSCQEGACDHQDLSDVPCEDGNACTVDGVCVAGECKGTTRLCDDGNSCTEDGCDPATGCTYAFNSDPCDDGNECTVGDVCVRGECQAGEGRQTCDDEDPCTDDFCVPGEGCVHVANTAECSDGDPCTVGDRCRRGECLPGEDALVCEDGDVCTDDTCVPGLGCAFTFNTAPCDDGELCTVGDTCDQGACVPGAAAYDCDDGDPCTDDSCVPGEGCVFAFNTAPCDDGNACTGADVCALGDCAGIDRSDQCEDGLVCTIDTCDPEKGCVRDVDNRPECRPQVVIDYPPRGVTLDGPREMVITGHIAYGLDGDQRFPQVLLVNGNPVLPMPPSPEEPTTWRFQYPMLGAPPMMSEQGMNPIVVDVNDSLGQKDHVVQSYYYSTKYYPVDVANPAASQVADGLVLFLGPEVWDDGDRTGNPNSIADILVLYLKTMDLMSFIDNPMATGSEYGCKYRVDITDITFDRNDIDVTLTPVDGGLYLRAQLNNIVVRFRADMSNDPLCVLGDFTGTASVNWLRITTTLYLSVDENGQAVVTPGDSSVTMSNLDIDTSNWLVNLISPLLEDSLKESLEDAFAEQIAAIVEPLQEALNGLAINEEFEIPSFIEGGQPTTLYLHSKLSRLDFTTAGGTVGMAATVVTEKGTPHNPLGSIGRAACLTGVFEPMPAFPIGTPDPGPPPLELALHDDFLNLIPYAIYWGGTLSMPVPEDMLGQDLSSYGITEMNLFVDFLLPPILTGCNEDGLLSIQAGDIGVQANMKLFGMPVQMQMYASFEADAEIVAVDGDEGKEISIAVREPTFIDVEIASLSGGLVGAEDTLGGLIRDMLMPELLGALTGESLGSFPIPEFDLSGMMEGLPEGTSIAIEIREVLRRAAYTVMSGNVK